MSLASLLPPLTKSWADEVNDGFEQQLLETALSTSYPTDTSRLDQKQKMEDPAELPPDFIDYEALELSDEEYTFKSYACVSKAKGISNNEHAAVLSFSDQMLLPNTNTLAKYMTMDIPRTLPYTIPGPNAGEFFNRKFEDKKHRRVSSEKSEEGEEQTMAATQYSFETSDHPAEDVPHYLENFSSYFKSTQTTAEFGSSFLDHEFYYSAQRNEDEERLWIENPLMGKDVVAIRESFAAVKSSEYDSNSTKNFHRGWMLSPQVWRAMGWQTTTNTDYDGAVLVGGLENELRHFGDPDEEHDFWADPKPSSPCPYTHEGTRAIATAEKKEKQQKLRSACKPSALGLCNYKIDTSSKSPNGNIVEDEGKTNEEEEDGYKIETDGEPLEFHDNWFGQGLLDNEECEVGLEDCAHYGKISKGRIVDDNERIDKCEQNIEDIEAVSTESSDTRTDQEDDSSDVDFEESFILMFNEELDIKGDTKETKNKIASIQPSKEHCFCRCGESDFIKIDDTNTINGLNGVAATPCPARAVIAAQPGIWRAMTACRPLERARRPQIVMPASWQAV
ncbi:hypothetical protein EYC80_004963 [Monilinia laxa]|uniref:Uncharacterized protein n=1 Tax=Monilinia laxa TaxID=61186 RepID=A0A5N6KIR5_MONLA|nr:hypothetical protein EYC80_004963 [Monilinia laxa]